MQTIMIMDGVIKLGHVHNGLPKPYTTSRREDLENKMKKTTVFSLLHLRFALPRDRKKHFNLKQK